MSGDTLYGEGAADQPAAQPILTALPPTSLQYAPSMAQSSTSMDSYNSSATNASFVTAANGGAPLDSATQAANSRYIPLPPPSFPGPAPVPAYYTPPPLFPASLFADMIFPHAFSVVITFFTMIFCPATPAAPAEKTTVETYGRKADETACKCPVPDFVPVFAEGSSHPGTNATKGDPSPAAVASGVVGAVLEDIVEASEEEEDTDAHDHDHPPARTHTRTRSVVNSKFAAKSPVAPPVRLHCSACGQLAPVAVQLSLLGEQYADYDLAQGKEAAAPVKPAPSTAPVKKASIPPFFTRVANAFLWLLPSSSADYMRYRHSLKICIALGIASMFALVPGQVIFVNPHWVPVTIGFIFSDNVGSGFLTSLARLQGTVLGAVFGYFAGMLSEYVDPEYDINYAWTCTCLLSLWALVGGYVRTGTTHVYAASVAVFTSVVIAIGIDKDYGRYALARIEMTICGIIIMLSVMSFVWPERAEKDTLKRIANVLKESVLCLELNFHLLHMSSVDEIEQTLRGGDAAAARQDKHTSDKLSYRLYGPSLLPGVNVDVVAKGRVTLGAALENIKSRFARAQAREREKLKVLDQLREVHGRYTYSSAVKVSGDAAQSSGDSGAHYTGETVDGSTAVAPLVASAVGAGDITLPMDSEEFMKLLTANRLQSALPMSPTPMSPLPAAPVVALQQNPFGAASVIRLFFSSLFPNIPVPESPAQFMVIYNRTIENKLTNMRTQVIVQRRLATESQAEPHLCGRSEAPAELMFDVIAHQVNLIRTLSRMQECLFLHQWCLERMEGKNTVADDLLTWKRAEDERRLQQGLAVRDKTWGRDLLKDIGLDAYQVTRQQSEVRQSAATRQSFAPMLAQTGDSDAVDYRSLDPEHYTNTFVEHTNAPAPSILDVVNYRDTLGPHGQEGHGPEYSVSMSHRPLTSPPSPTRDATATLACKQQSSQRSRRRLLPAQITVPAGRQPLPQSQSPCCAAAAPSAAHGALCLLSAPAL